MKDKALYHLLQLRATQIEQVQSPDIREALSSLKGALRIEVAGPFFMIRWRHHNMDHELSVPADDFAFYLRGDSKAGPSSRDQREQNWQTALDLWKRLCAISDIALDWDKVPRDLAPHFGTTADRPTISGGFLGPTVAALAGAAAIAFLLRNIGPAAMAGQALAGFIAILSLAMFVPALGNGHVLSPARPGGLALLAAGVVAATALGLGLVAPALMFATMVLIELAAGDRRAPTALMWPLAGALAGFLAAADGALAPATGVVVLGPVLIWLFVRYRMKTRNVAGLALGFAIGLLVVVLGGVPPVLTAPLPASPIMSGEAAIDWITTITATVAVIIAGTWWIFGVTFRFTAWMSLNAIAIAGVTAILVQDISVRSIAVSSIGLIGLTVARLHERIRNDR
jgi:hypothetical protein